MMMLPVRTFQQVEDEKVGEVQHIHLPHRLEDQDGPHRAHEVLAAEVPLLLLHQVDKLAAEAQLLLLHQVDVLAAEVPLLLLHQVDKLAAEVQLLLLHHVVVLAAEVPLLLLHQVMCWRLKCLSVCWHSLPLHPHSHTHGHMGSSLKTTIHISLKPTHTNNVTNQNKHILHDNPIAITIIQKTTSPYNIFQI